jgi:carboxylate-amine ligase
MTAEFGLVARQQLTCGQHVHVSVESREEGVAVLDRIRPWLAVLNAVSANSPFWQGADTGYASYRNILWNQWPTAGPTDAFGSVAGYDERVASLVSSGAALDDAMIYFDARLSAQYPTVEIRVADVCSSVDYAVLIAAICRALVETTAGEAQRGVDYSPPGVGILRAAAWRAARWGLAGTLVDVRRGGTTAAMRLVDELVDYIRPALIEFGDEKLVDSGIELLRERGTGADAQRAWAREPGGLSTVVSRVAERTLAA